MLVWLAVMTKPTIHGTTADLVHYCGNSCLGRSEQAGITGFWINDTDYGWSLVNVTCEQNAGVSGTHSAVNRWCGEEVKHCDR